MAAARRYPAPAADIDAANPFMTILLSLPRPGWPGQERLSFQWMKELRS
jgi:hypothetical protein